MKWGWAINDRYIDSAREPTEVCMKDELFADLLASAEEMVRIEKGEQPSAKLMWKRYAKPQV